MNIIIYQRTGEQSNSGLVIVIASVLLAVGSLLTFKKLLNQIKLSILLTSKLITWIWSLVINSFQSKYWKWSSLKGVLYKIVNIKTHLINLDFFRSKFIKCVNLFLDYILFL